MNTYYNNCAEVMAPLSGGSASTYYNNCAQAISPSGDRFKNIYYNNCADETTAIGRGILRTYYNNCETTGFGHIYMLSTFYTANQPLTNLHDLHVLHG